MEDHAPARVEYAASDLFYVGPSRGGERLIAKRAPREFFRGRFYDRSSCIPGGSRISGQRITAGFRPTSKQDASPHPLWSW